MEIAILIVAWALVALVTVVCFFVSFKRRDDKRTSPDGTLIRFKGINCGNRECKKRLAGYCTKRITKCKKWIV